MQLARRPMQVHALLKKEGLFDKVKKYCKDCCGQKIKAGITKNRQKKL